MTQKQYEKLLAKADKTPEELEQLKAYEDEHNSDNPASGTDDSVNDNNSGDGNPTNTNGVIDDLHDQNPEKLNDSLDKKEKSAQYQKAKKEKAESEKEESGKSSSGGFISFLVLLVAIFAGLFFFFKNNDEKGIKETSSDKKTGETGNWTGNDNGDTGLDTGLETGTLSGVFNDG